MVALGSKRAIFGGTNVNRKRNQSRSHQRNRSTTNELELTGITADEDELSLPITKTKEEFQSSINLITNNKLNGTNSWEVPIIEYFHDMNLLRGDDGSINFQTASTTLDGCTKIMSKRVDLIATEADSLLAMMQVKRKKKDISEGDEDKNDPEWEQSKKNRTKVAKKTDVLDSFNKLKISDQQLERVNIDPVFRNMVAEFDEGGTKSLLLNTLRISSEGRVMLDDAIPKDLEDIVNLYDNDDDASALSKSMIKIDSDDELEAEADKDKNRKTNSKIKEEDSNDVTTLITNFKLLIQLGDMNTSKLIPSMNKLWEFIENDEQSTSFMDIFNDKVKAESDIMDEEMPEYHVEYDYDVDSFDLGKEEGQATNISEDTHFDADNRPDYDNSFSNCANLDENDQPVHVDGDINMLNVSRKLQKEADIMEALDRQMNKRLGKSHWKIRSINSRPQIFRFNLDETEESKGYGSIDDFEAKKKREQLKTKKSAYVIDFLKDDKDSKDIFTNSANEETRKNKSAIIVDETTLPDLKYWQADRLTECFIQPKRTLHNIYAQSDYTLDGSYWAARYNDKNNDNLAYTVPGHEEEVNGGSDSEDQDVDFGDTDMDAGMYDFDAIPDNNPNANQIQDHGRSVVVQPKVEIIRSNKPHSKDTIHYERRVKRINVRLLKKNLWDVTKEKQVDDVALSSVVRDTYERYEGREREDLSTSFFFICMLHIANEEGLSIESTQDMNDLIIHQN